MDQSDRLISCILYALAGIGLGIVIAIYCSLYGVLTTINSIYIIIFTALTCSFIGYLFPNLISLFFRWMWNIFK
jgi:hypothetical protein